MSSPCAIRLRTESDWEDGRSPPVPGAPPALGAAVGSPVWKERYSCIMYRGYGTRRDDERIPGPGLGLGLARSIPWGRERAPGQRARSTPEKHSNATSISAETRSELGEIGRVLKEPGEAECCCFSRSLGVEWCCQQSDSQTGLFIGDSCPLMTP